VPSNLKAIDTEYRGRLFRSRTEARWAIFFDEVGLDWEYEPEGFELPSGARYLPDFKLMRKHGGHAWVEVKPRTTKADPKFAEFEEHVGWNAKLVSGTPLEFIEDGGRLCPRCGIPEMVGPYGESVYCGPCDMETPGGGDNPLQFDGITPIPYIPHKGCIELTSFWEPAFRSHLHRLAERAQKARFEHGARP